MRAEDDSSGIEPIREDHPGAFVLKRVAAIGQQGAALVVNGNGEAAPHYALGRIARSELLTRLRRQAENGDELVLHLQIIERLEGLLLLRCPCSGNGAFPGRWHGGVRCTQDGSEVFGDELGRFLLADLLDLGDELDDVAAAAAAKAVPKPLGRRDDELAVFAALVNGTRAAKLRPGTL